MSRGWCWRRSVGLAPENKLRVIAPDVGGGFGSKIFIYAEETVCAWAAKKIDRPVKWTSDRTEAFLSTRTVAITSRTRNSRCDASGKITGMRVHTIANLGAYLSTFASLVPTYLYAPLLSGQYAIPSIYCEVDGVYTNTAPVDAYRGAGRPEATFVVERLVEVAAREAGVDPAEFRRRNFVTSFPHQTPVIMAYDVGDYGAALDKAMTLADYKGVGARKAASAAKGKLRGIGLSAYIEACGLGPSRAIASMGGGVGGWESAEVRVNPTGSVEVHDRLAQSRPRPRDHLRAVGLFAPRHSDREHHRRPRRHRQGAVRHGDLWLAVGRGRHGGNFQGARQDRGQGEEGRRPRARSLGGGYRVQGRQVQVKGTDKSIDFGSVALSAYVAHKFDGQELEPGLKEGAFWDPTNFTFPAGVHICELEIDPQTGVVTIERWTAVDDFGQQINPMIVAGQVHGGIAQGVGQALHEGAHYNSDGQLLTASYMDYTMPRAEDLPSFKVDFDRNAVSLEPSRHQGLRGGRRDRLAASRNQRPYRRARP